MREWVGSWVIAHCFYHNRLLRKHTLVMSFQQQAGPSRDVCPCQLAAVVEVETASAMVPRGQAGRQWMVGGGGCSAVTIMPGMPASKTCMLTLWLLLLGCDCWCFC
jgi:hypothetical protein